MKQARIRLFQPGDEVHTALSFSFLFIHVAQRSDLTSAWNAWLRLQDQRRCAPIATHISFVLSA